MAVEKARVIDRLKALFPKANLSKKRLNAIADKLAKKPEDDAEDSAIDEVINDFNDVISIEDIAKDDDRARSLEAQNAKLLKNQKSDPNPDPDDDDEDPIPDDTPDWAKKMFKQNQEMRQELNSIKSGKVTDAKTEQVRKLFGESEVLKGLTPEMQERLIKTVDLESETSLEDQVELISTDYSDLVQKAADSTDHAGGAGGGGKPKEVSQEAVDKVVDGMKI